MSKSKAPTFQKAISSLQLLFNISFLQADQMVQDTYSDFKKRNELLGQRQDDEANRSYISLIAHTTTLATLTITALGILASQNLSVFSQTQKILFLLIILCEITAIFLGVIDYIQTIFFHEKWSKIYHSIDTEVNNKFETGELQLLGDMNKIESRHVSTGPQSTNKNITYGMIVASLIGLLLTFLLFWTFFFNVPGTWQ